MDPVTIPGVIDRVTKAYDGNVFETESAINDFLAQHANAPVKTLRDILLSGKVVPSRVRALMSSVGKSTEEAGYRQVVLTAADTRQVVLTLMADNKLDALVYATFDHQPPRIASDVMTKAVVDDVTGLGNNRRLSPALGFRRWRCSGIHHRRAARRIGIHGKALCGSDDVQVRVCLRTEDASSQATGFDARASRCRDRRTINRANHRVLAHMS